MNIPPPELPPASSPESREWMDRVAQCATSCAKTIESRRLLTSEIPLVLASLTIALADKNGIPVPRVIEMIGKAATLLHSATPEHRPEGIPA